jgi:hypothetical protein
MTKDNAKSKVNHTTEIVVAKTNLTTNETVIIDKKVHKEVDVVVVEEKNQKKTKKESTNTTTSVDIYNGTSVVIV